MAIEESIAGRRVKTFDTGFSEASQYYNFGRTDSPYVATVINVYHGTYDDNWLIIEENGKEVRRIGINQFCSIEWWDGDIDKDEVPL